VLIISPIAALSSNSWILLWIFLEIGSIAFIIIIIKEETFYSKENSIKYFLIQTVASSIILIAFLSKEHLNYTSIQLSFLFPIRIATLAFSIKIAAAPFHTWMPSLAQSMKWEIIAIILTWQKIIPLFILMKTNKFILIILIASSSIVIGTTSQFNITSAKLIIALSSIAHGGWMLIAIYSNNNLPLIYLIIYSSISIPLIFFFKKNKIKSLIQQIRKKSKIHFILLILSIAGIPPLLGFIPKWIVLSRIREKIKSIIITTFIVIIATINFFYLHSFIHKPPS